MTDALTLTVGGRALSGWEEIAVTLSCEAMPNSFSVRASQPVGGGGNPLIPASALVNDGDACTVQLDADTVITGYVDAVVAGYDASSHLVQIVGRGKCQDLVDASAEWKGFQISGTNALDIAQKLAKPYGLSVTMVGDPGPQIPQFNFGLGETPQEILELVCRHAGFLYYEDGRGNLVLSRTGSAQAASGFTEGVNVQAASSSRSMADRYSDYKASAYSVFPSDIFKDDSGIFLGRSKDPNVKRNRKLYLVDSAIGTDAQKYLQQRADWEAARRFGRSRLVRVTVDSWRDAKGKLWAPNSLAQVALPRLGLPATQLVIAEVTFRASLSGGKVAEVTLMPPAAFPAQPVVLQPALVDLAAEPAFKTPRPMTLFIERLGRKLRQMIGFGKAATVDDSGAQQVWQLQVFVGGDADLQQVLDKVTRLSEYGFFSVPPAKAEAVVLYPDGERSGGVIIATGHRATRPKALQAGEAGIYNGLTGKILRMGHDGKAYLNGPLQIDGDVVIAGDVQVTGNLTFDGNLTVTGDVTVQGQLHAPNI